MTSSSLIDARDLERRDAKSNRLILDRVTMSIRPGDRIGLVGPSGSGKSSLLRAIAMLDQCDSGEVRYDGELICNDAVPGFRRRVAYLPQRPSFVLGTVRENLQLPFRFASAKVPFDPSLVDLWLHRLAASTDLLDQPVSQLSGGQQQIVALVRAIQIAPQVLLLDEPTASLDAESTTRFEDLVLAWQRETDEAVTRAFVWTSHDEAQIDRVTVRRIHMAGGKLTLEATHA